MTEQEFKIKKYRLRLNLLGMIDYELIDDFWLQDIIYSRLLFDEKFTKSVDEITGSKISEKISKDEKTEEINNLLFDTSRCLVVVNLVFRYLSHLANSGANLILDEHWKNKINNFKGF